MTEHEVERIITPVVLFLMGEIEEGEGTASMLSYSPCRPRPHKIEQVSFYQISYPEGTLSSYYIVSMMYHTAKFDLCGAGARIILDDIHEDLDRRFHFDRDSNLVEALNGVIQL